MATYEQIEASLFGGQPVEYWRFELNSQFFYYNPTKNDETLFGNTYKAAFLKRGNHKQNIESVTDVTTKVVCERDFEIAELFKTVVPERTVWLTVFRKHRGSPDSEARTVWVGRIRGCEWDGKTAKLNAEPLGTIVKRGGLRMNFQKQCNHFLYSASCGVDPASFLLAGEVQSINGLQITSNVFAQKPDQWLRLGFIEYNSYFYMVINHVGTTVDLFAPIEGIKESTDQSILAYAGCRRNLNDCWNKFGNGRNYGGFPWSKSKNAFVTGIR